MSSKHTVISIGGSVMIPNEPSAAAINDTADLLRDSGKRILIVVGGGQLARKYISLARELGADETHLDEIGIEATRLNSRLLISSLGNEVYPVPARNFDEAIQASADFPFVVMGGTHPGHTTDAVASMLAERINAERLIIATNVKGVYTSDPAENHDARLFSNMTPSGLIEIAKKMESGAGKSGVVDPLAARIIQRAGIPTLVFDGRNTKILEQAVVGNNETLANNFQGTFIRKNLKLKFAKEVD